MKWIFFMLVAVMSLAGCKSTEYVRVPEYHTEYVVRTDTFAKTDSVYLKDSVYIYQKGDTVFHNKVSYRDRYHNIYKVKTDTLVERDSVNVPYPVERKLTKNEQRFMTLGRCYIGFLFLLAACAVGITIWYRNKKDT